MRKRHSHHRMIRPCLMTHDDYDDNELDENDIENDNNERQSLRTQQSPSAPSDRDDTCLPQDTFSFLICSHGLTLLLGKVIVLFQIAIYVVLAFDLIISPNNPYTYVSRDPAYICTQYIRARRAPRPSYLCTSIRVMLLLLFTQTHHATLHWRHKTQRTITCKAENMTGNSMQRVIKSHTHTHRHLSQRTTR